MIRKIGGMYHWQLGNYGGSFYRKAVKRSKCKAMVPYVAKPDRSDLYMDIASAATIVLVMLFVYISV